MAAPAAILSILVTANTAGAVKGLGRVNAQLGGTEARAGKAAAAFKSAAKVMALGAAGAGAASVKLAVDFDRSMRNVNSIAQLPEKRLQSLSKRVRELGGRTAQSPKTLAEGLYDLVSSGFDADESMGILRKSARAASAGLTDTKTSTKAVAAVLNAYRRPAKDAGKVSDTLFRTVDRGVISFEELAANIGDTLPFAAELGVSLEEVGAATATMTKQGLGSSETMTRIRNILQSMIKPGEGLKKAFREIGVESGETLIKQEGLQGALEKLIGTTDGSKRAVADLFPNIRALGGVLSLTGGNSKAAAKDLEGMRDSSGATSKALSQQSKSVAFQWNRLKAQAESLAIGFGNKLLPEISNVLKVLSDPKLSGEEKFDRIIKLLSDAVSRAIPAIAGAAADAAPVVARAFVSGFKNAGVWAQLAGGVWLAKKLGLGRGLFGLLGRGLKGGGGGVLGNKPVPVFVTNPGGMPGKGGPKVPPVVTTGGKILAAGSRLVPVLAAGAVIAYIAAKNAKNNFPTRGPQFDSTRGATPFNPAGQRTRVLGGTVGPTVGGKDETFAAAAAGAEQAEKRIRKVRKEIRMMRDGSVTDASELAREVKDRFRRIEESIGLHTREGRRLANKNFRGAVRELGDAMASGKIKADEGMSTIRDLLKDRSRKGKEGLAGNVREAVKAIRKGMDAGVVATDEGTAEIDRLMVTALQGMGFSRKAAINLRKAQRSGSAQTPGANGELRPNQRGGFQMGGKPSGDSIPSLLERGEYVVNRNAVKKVGKAALDRLNFGAAPRFQQGGIVELLHPFNDPRGHGGDNSHLHIAMLNGIEALGRRLERMGWLISGHPAWGGATPGVHAENSYHYRNQAIDANWPMPGEEAAKIKALLPMLGGNLAALGGVAAPQLKRLLVDGPASPLKGIVQGALDTVTAGAQARVDAAAASSMSVEGAEGGFSGSWTKVMAQIAKSRGWNLAAWRRLVQKESGGDPTARNPTSGAFGLGQFLGATAQSYAKYGALSSNPVEQIQAMAKYIADRYGNPSAALSFHDQNNWYAAGGLVGKAGKGAAMLGAGRRGATLGRTLRKLKTGKTPKIRNTAVRKLLDRVKGIGLPRGVEKKLGTLAKDANVFGEMADRAATLSTEDADGNPILGVVGGKNQAQWLEDQLAALFKWRNQLLVAEQVATSKRAQVTELIERARDRLEKLRRRVRRLTVRKRTLEKTLRKLEKHPKRNRQAIRQTRRALRQTNRDLRPELRARDTLKDRILPALTGQRSGLNTARGDLLSTLEDVQGVGSPMHVMTGLPTVGVLGGQILQVQTTLRDLNAPRPRITDTDTGASERESILEELLRQANLRTAVSERQFGVLRDFPPYMGAFAKGGVALLGERGPELAHMPSGTRVHSASDTQALLAPSVQVIVYEGEGRADVFVNDQKIEAVVDRKLRRVARGGNRPMPGRGGGGLR